MRLLLLLLAAASASAAGMDEATTRKLIDKVLAVPTAEVDPRLVDPFLALDPETAPKPKRKKVAARQIEIRTLFKLHDTKKKGAILQPVPGCTVESGVKSHAQVDAYKFAGYEEVQEDERDEVEKRTMCTETDMVCQFSLVIFHDKGSKKPRRIFFHANDPLMAIVAGIRGKAGGQTKFFGLGGVTCSK
jgi:hypothetical protein